MASQMLEIPYARQSSPDYSDYIRMMSDLMLRRGDAIARSRLARGASTAAAWQNAGNVIANTFSGIGNQREKEAEIARQENQRRIENEMRERDMAERHAARLSDEEWRRMQFRAQYADKAAEDVMPNTRISEAEMAQFTGTPAAGRFREVPGQPAQPAWQAEAVGDEMADAGPAQEAVPMSYMRKPNAQEAIALQNAELARQDRIARDRQFTINQGQEEDRARTAQANADRTFNEQVRQFNVTEGRLNKKDTLFGFGGLEGLSGPEILDKLPPADAALIKGILDYRSDITKVTTLRGDQRLRVAQLANLIDPTFDMTQYGARQALVKDFRSGKSSQNIRSLNTAVGHLKDFSDAAANMKNYNWQIINRAGNWLKTQTGDPTISALQTAATAVEGELANVFKNTGGTDQEIAQWRRNFSEASSPEQFKSAINTAIGLLGSRLNALTFQYSNGMGKPKDFDILSPKSRDILNGLGFDPERLEPSSDMTTFKLPEQELQQQKSWFDVQEEANPAPPMFGPRQPIAAPTPGLPRPGFNFGRR